MDSLGVKGRQSGAAGDEDDAGGAAGRHQDPVWQTAPPGERESAAEIKDPRPGDGEMMGLTGV